MDRFPYSAGGPASKLNPCPKPPIPSPEDVDAEIKILIDALDRDVPSKRLDDNLLICTWNIRAFGGWVDKWRSTEDDTPKRDLLSLHLIANVVRRFNVVAIQEAKGNLRALRQMLDILGPDWGLILTDVTEGAKGNDERLAFVFDMRRAKPSGLADPHALRGELSVGQADFHPGHPACDLRQEPERPGGRAEGDRRVHGQVGQGHQLAGAEPHRPGRLQHRPPRRPALPGLHLDRPAYPMELNLVPRTIFGNSKKNSYDQIAWFTGEGGNPALSLAYRNNAGHFDFTQYVLPGMAKGSMSWRISDHSPLWAEFHTR